MSKGDHPDNSGGAVHLVRASEDRVPRTLAAATGMQRLHFSEMHLASGENAILGAVDAELFVYVLRGRGEVESSGETLELAVGDFLGAAGPLSITNPHPEEFVYLSGGENS